MREHSLLVRFRFSITIVLTWAGVIISALGIVTSVALANGYTAECEYSFTKTDCEDYVTIDPASGTIKYNLVQETIDNDYYIDRDISYRIGYKATFQFSYTNKYVELTGNGDSTGFKSLIKQYGVRNYHIELDRVTIINARTEGVLKLKVTK